MQRNPNFGRLSSCILFICSVLAFTGCTQTGGTLTGAAIGTGAGAGIGYAIGGKGGAVLGGALGGLTGAAIGNHAAEQLQSQKADHSDGFVKPQQNDEISKRYQTIEYDKNFELDMKRLELEQKRLELERERLELEKSK